MKVEEFVDIFKNDIYIENIINSLNSERFSRISLSGLIGSSAAVVAALVIKNIQKPQVFILPDKESAAYFFNDLESLFEDSGLDFYKKRILFFPASYKRAGDFQNLDTTNVLLRTEVLKRVQSDRSSPVFVTYPEALCEKVTSTSYIQKHTFRISLNEIVSLDFLVEILVEYEFARVDFVVEPGQYAIRGGIIDVFSYSNDTPYRIEFDGDKIGSMRTFDPCTQLSLDNLNHLTIVSNVLSRSSNEERLSFLSFLNGEAVLWIDDIKFTIDKINDESKHILNESNYEDDDICPIKEELLTDGDDFSNDIKQFPLIEINHRSLKSYNLELDFETSPQHVINKNFDLLFDTLIDNYNSGYRNFILTSSSDQVKRFNAIFEDLAERRQFKDISFFVSVPLDISQGFYYKRLKIACFTDHQIFGRYHKFKLKDSSEVKQAITIKDIYDLNPGDYVTHIDYGIGRFAGLEKIEINGKYQEAIKLIYQNNDLLYVNIHSLHRISKYSGREGSVPVLDRLGGSSWNQIKRRTRQKVKDIAKDLIALYAKRRASIGFEFSPDTYLQHELEASFIYEDTPDQLKATEAVKKDMEASYPMDRLICGDVGFGKTEIAIRAAFKAVADSKQVAVLVPTTILALQHYRTFSDRLKDFPCKVEYLNRFKTSKEQKQIIEDLKSKKIDIIIGTHRLLSKDIDFNDIGLLIIDEEQKFGVAAKEKIKNLKINIDTLALTATPIPRTLQFSLMGARDLSIIKTPPPNRYTIQTRLGSFDEELIKNAINYEVARGGQVFFVHNRIENIVEVANIIQKFCPNVNIAVAHAKLNGLKLEKIMLDYIEGKYDVLVTTTIIESGLDIPNANTIIVNDAQNYGLSDLHQLRGRVGRTNRRAFCYLLSPPLESLSDEARKRLKAIEEFSDLGSGFNIAMRDLDIRGAGNILGAEQSGFISEIGFEMYLKILEEAVTELKDTEFAGFFVEDKNKRKLRECHIETDLELMFPDNYIENATERLHLYKELDNIEDEKDLQTFASHLTDRFGKIPMPAEELFNIVRLKWIAPKLGFEKIILKNGRMTCCFIADKGAEYYASEEFTRFLYRINSQDTIKCRLKETNEKLEIVIKDVKSAKAGLEIFLELEKLML